MANLVLAGIITIMAEIRQALPGMAIRLQEDKGNSGTTIIMEVILQTLLAMAISLPEDKVNSGIITTMEAIQLKLMTVKKDLPGDTGSGIIVSVAILQKPIIGLPVPIVVLAGITTGIR